MQTKPLDLLRQAHRIAEGKLDVLERSARLIGQNGDTAALESLDELFGFFDGELKVHFRHEEEILFPYLGQVIGREGPIAVMLDEHQTLWHTLDTLRETAKRLRSLPADPASLKALPQIANHIVSLLRSHILKENSILFPMAEQVLNPQTLREVVERITALEAPAT